MRALPSLFAGLATVAALTFSASALTVGQDGYFDHDTGYRVSRYRAPTPETVAGGTRIDIDELDRLVGNEDAILLDVMIAEGGGPDPKSGVWRLSKPRKSLPNAVWLANVGKGQLSPEIETYLRANLEQLTDGDKSRPIIIFCMADCWMSWNAVKRAAQLGYTRVYWYPEGTDGWRDWDRTFAAAVPVPLTRVKTAATATPVTYSATTKLPLGAKTISLVSHTGERIEIGDIEFTETENSGTRAFKLTLREAPFQDEFLSMRPFRCLPDRKEMWCYLAYPYEIESIISASDLQPLEYSLLFLFKPPTGYGIDAWNGLYFKLELDGQGNLTGTVQETDMNVLAVPPDAGVTRPISHDALTAVEPDTHRFYQLEIK